VGRKNRRLLVPGENDRPAVVRVLPSALGRASPARLTCSAPTAPANSRCPTTGTRAVACTSAVAGTV